MRGKVCSYGLSIPFDRRFRRRFNAVAAMQEIQNTNDFWKTRMLSEGRPVVLVTAEHLLVGTVATKEQRISDILNDHRTDYVHIRNVRVFRRAGNQCVGQLQHCIVPKSKLSLVLILDQKHEARTKRLNNFVEKQADSVFLTVDGYEVRGWLHLNGTTDPVWYLTQQTRLFFPITKAEVSRVLCDADSLQASVAIVHKDAVTLFCLGEATGVEESALEPTSSGLN